jgi:hypothetical protein
VGSVRLAVSFRHPADVDYENALIEALLFADNDVRRRWRMNRRQFTRDQP